MPKSFNGWLLHATFPPLVLFWPHAGYDVHHGGDHHEHQTKHPNIYAYTSLRPIFSVVLVFLTMYRFSTDADLTVRGARDFLVGPLRVPVENSWWVDGFWAAVLAMLTIATYVSRPASPHGVSHLLIPEIVALFAFFVADVTLEWFWLLDKDHDKYLTLEEIMTNWPLILPTLPKRWIQVNQVLLLAFTITEGISPTMGSGVSILFDAGWSLLLMQAVTSFLHETNVRGEILAEWASPAASVVYGFSLYFWTHSMALLALIVFRKHEGAHHPPKLTTVTQVLMRADPVGSVLRMGSFLACLCCATLLPALADNSLAAAGVAAETVVEHVAAAGAEAWFNVERWLPDMHMVQAAAFGASLGIAAFSPPIDRLDVYGCCLKVISFGVCLLLALGPDFAGRQESGHSHGDHVHHIEAQHHQPQHQSRSEKEEPAWLRALSQGLFAGPWAAGAQTAVCLVALLAAFRVCLRRQVAGVHASFEAALTWSTGCLASFCWASLLLEQDEETPSWRYWSILLAAVSHVLLAAFSADVFAGRQVPRHWEAFALTLWAATQCFQGLSAEHHAATAHHAHGHSGGLSIAGLLEHLGEFGLCEFGLITTLGWLTTSTELVSDWYGPHMKH